MEQEMSKEMDEFLDKVDTLCWEYGYQILPNPNKLKGELDTIIISGSEKDGDVKLTCIDGDGRGK